jgi:thiol:disulfide interchange protein DsbD
MTSALRWTGASLLAALALLWPGDIEAAKGAQPAGIRWEPSFAAALQKAGKTGRPLLIDFWAEWCGWCHTFDRTTYVDPAVVELSRGFVAVKVDTEGSQDDVAVAARYRVASLPTVLFLAPSGTVVFRLSGYQRPRQFAETLEWVRTETERVGAWEQALAANPRDAETLMHLGFQQLENDQFENGRDLLARARSVDGALPSGERKRLRHALGVVRILERDFSAAEALLKEGLTLTPVDREADPQMLYALGRLYLDWGRREDALAAFKRLVAEFPKSPVADTARRAVAFMGPSS